jgi:hypothetical protein
LRKVIHFWLSVRDATRNFLAFPEMAQNAVELIAKRWEFVKDKDMVQNSAILLSVCILTSFLIPEIPVVKWLVRLLMMISSSNILLLLSRERKFEPVVETTLTPRKTPRKTTNASVPLTKQVSPLKQSRLIFQRSSPLSPQIQDTDFVRSRLVVNQPVESVIFSGFTSLPNKFQNALKPSQSPVKKKIIEDGLIFKDADYTLSKWHIENYIDIWTENMRRWVAKHVLQSLVQRIDNVDGVLKNMGWDHLTTTIATLATGMSSLSQPTGLNNQPQRPNSLIDLQRMYSKEPIALERLALERHLAFEQREYVIERVRQLARGSGVASYRWNGGQKFKDIPWSPQQFPTDGFILMSLFCRFMDEKCPGEGLFFSSNHRYSPNSMHPFTTKYYVDIPKSKHATGIRIRQASKFPPHYQILIDDVVYDVPSGRNNLFDTLALFVYQIKMNYNGYLG